MTTTKVQPPRKLTEDEDLDSFEDWWFQVECYYSRDAKFADFFDKKLTWTSRSDRNRGLESAEVCSNLNTLLRALATYTSGPYVKNELLDATKSLKDVRRVFLKFLEIEVTDHSLLNYYSLTRRANERPLVYYHRLRYHILQHQLPTGTRISPSKTLDQDDTVSASMERFIIMEWLYRLDSRLIKFIQEKFATELSSSSTYLLSAVESLAKNVDKYITQLDSMSTVNLLPTQDQFSPSMHKGPDVRYQEEDNDNSGIMFNRSGFKPRSNRGGFGRGQPRPPFQQRPRQNLSRQPNKNCKCEFCYMQVRGQGKNYDYNHDISNCPHMIARFSKINLALEQESDQEREDENQEFEDFYSDTTSL